MKTELPTLQEIENKYIQQGLRGNALRQALAHDEEYRRILAERKSKLTKQFSISEQDLGKYVLSIDEDWEILSKIYQLEKKPLSEHDSELIRLIRSQLEDDWRKPLKEKLGKLLKKYVSE